MGQVIFLGVVNDVTSLSWSWGGPRLSLRLGAQYYSRTHSIVQYSAKFVPPPPQLQFALEDAVRAFQNVCIFPPGAVCVCLCGCPSVVPVWSQCLCVCPSSVLTRPPLGITPFWHFIVRILSGYCPDCH